VYRCTKFHDLILLAPYTTASTNSSNIPTIKSQPQTKHIEAKEYRKILLKKIYKRIYPIYNDVHE
jgi:hypothetical protein